QGVRPRVPDPRGRFRGLLPDVGLLHPRGGGRDPVGRSHPGDSVARRGGADHLRQGSRAPIVPPGSTRRARRGRRPRRVNEGAPRLAFERDHVEDFVSVVIPVYRDAPGLADTLDSLDRQTLRPTEYEIIVSNDGGDPEVRALCEARGVTEVSIVPNRGSYFARNRGIERTAGENLAFVDADIIVP